MTALIDTESTSAEGSPAASATVRAPAPFAKLLGLTAGLGVILAVLLLVFIMPSLKSGPHDLPLGIVGTSDTIAQVEAVLADAAPDAYVTEGFASEADLRAAIEAREVVGGLVVGASGVDGFVASAGSAAISTAVTATAQAVAAATGGTAQITDVVPLPATDPAGIGIGGLAFPLVFGGIVPAVAFRKTSPTVGWAVAGIAVFSVVGGLIVAGVLMGVFGSITAGFWGVAAAMALGIAALALPLAGLQEAFGGKGFTIGAMAMMFLGNPLAGISTTSAWLPGILGTVGQILPPGAAGTLVRSAAYFGGAGGVTAGLTLGAWVLAGIVLLVIGARRNAPAAAAA